jgi:hypothetical protein
MCKAAGDTLWRLIFLCGDQCLAVGGASTLVDLHLAVGGCFDSELSELFQSAAGAEPVARAAERAERVARAVFAKLDEPRNISLLYRVIVDALDSDIIANAAIAAGAAPALSTALDSNRHDATAVRYLCSMILRVVSGAAAGPGRHARADAFAAAGALATLQQLLVEGPAPVEAAAADDDDDYEPPLANVVEDTLLALMDLPSKRLYLATLPSAERAVRLVTCDACWFDMPRRVAAPDGCTVLHYHSGWSQPSLHGDWNGWVDARFELARNNVRRSGWWVITLPTTAAVHFVATNGEGSWDNPPGGGNYGTLRRGGTPRTKTRP